MIGLIGLNPPLARVCCILAVVLLCLPSAGLAAETIPEGLARPTDPLLLRSLVGKPQTINAAVTTIQRSGKPWCATQADCQAVFRLPLAALARILLNHEAYPEVMPRVSGNLVKREGDRIEETQTMTFNVAGFAYTIEYTLRGRDQLLDNPPRLLNQWEQTGSDGSIEGIAGLWYLEEFSLDGAIHTYVRYRVQSEIPQIVPGQPSLMMLFLGHDVAEAMLVLAKAASRP